MHSQTQKKHTQATSSQYGASWSQLGLPQEEHQMTPQQEPLLSQEPTSRGYTHLESALLEQKQVQDQKQVASSAANQDAAHPRLQQSQV